MSQKRPKTKATFAASPIYTGGKSIESVKEKHELEKVIKLASNENPFGSSEYVVDAIQKAVGELNRYPMQDESLREALAQSLGRELTAAYFITGNGGCDILDLLAQAYLEPDDEIIICTPTFPIYELTGRRMGAQIVDVPLTADFQHDIPAILAAITPKTKLIYTCSPNNPTGAYITNQQMQQLVEGAPAHVLIVADEVYHHFVTAADIADSLSHVLNNENLLILHSFSKVFGMAGLRLGYAIAPPDIIDYLTRARLPFHLNNLTLIGAEAGLQDAEYIRRTVELTVSGRDYIFNQLQALEVEAWPSQANFVLFKPLRDSKQLAEQLEKEGIIVRELSGFYMPGYLRVSVGFQSENERFIETLQRLL